MMPLRYRPDLRGYEVGMPRGVVLVPEGTARAYRHMAPHNFAAFLRSEELRLYPITEGECFVTAIDAYCAGEL